ncbi:hypothetical protein QFC19_000101 [Naganishia cerealis]|uniref:Uncharacterized protein n=1 Tax=Naganishia cerealis TaxID=610337 RepID=A0ACC2WS98_9TREE|nr:hypothetical protein QFC19_000101 [Naganishia cerealis]
MTTMKPARTAKVSFSPDNRHHPYNPALRVATTLKQAASYTSFAPNLGDAKNSITISPIGSSSVVGSTPEVPVPSESSNIPSSDERLPTPSGLTTSTPLNRNPLQPYSTAPGSRSLVKSILKRARDTPIRIAATVEEGTRENTEQARRGSSSPTKESHSSVRPTLKPADSLQFLVTRSTQPHRSLRSITSVKDISNAPAEGLDRDDNVLNSDDTVTSEEGGRTTSSGDSAISGNGNGENLQPGLNVSNEDPQPEMQLDASSLPEDGIVEIKSVDLLLDIIIREVDDLMAVEDAYNLISVRFRKLFTQGRSIVDTIEEGVIDPASELASALDSFKKCSSDIYRSFIRDIGRLVGTSISSIPPPVLDSSPPPKEHLDPTKGEITPSPSPETNTRFASFIQQSRKATAHLPTSPTLGIARLANNTNAPPSPNPTRRGYSEAQVLYRRSLAGVGQSSLRFLAFVFHRSELYQCFSDADITSLIESVLVIPNTPKLYTPNPKKSYALAMYSLCHLKVPVVCVQPIKEKLMRVLTYGLGNGGLKCWGGGPGKREGEGGNVKARSECFSAMANALVQYPSLFVPRHKDLIPLILGGLIDNQQGMKVKAGMALCGFIKGRMNWLRNTDRAVKELQARLAVIDELELSEKERTLSEVTLAVQAWKWARKVETESEVTTMTFLKSNLRPSLVVNPQRPKVSDAIVDLIRKALNTDPLWACAMWSCLVSTMGQGFLRESSRYREMNALVLSVLGDQEQQQKCAGRTALCRLAWNHTIFAIFNYRSQQYIKEASATPCRYYNINYPFGDKMMTAILSLPSEVRRIEELLPEIAEIVYNAEGKQEWSHALPVPMRAWLESCATSVTSIIYAYTGAIMRCTPREDEAESIQGDPVAQAALIRDRFGKVFDSIVMGFLPSMLSTKAMDGIITEAWGILRALVQRSPNNKLKSWSMSRLLCEAFFRNETVNRDLTPSYRDRMCSEAAGEMLSNGVQPGDIPAWGTELICSKFVGGFGDLFINAVTSLHGVEKYENTGEWVKMGEAEDDAPLMPKTLADVWEALMEHVALQVEDLLLHQLLAEVTRILVELYKMDVTLYTPICLPNQPGYDPEVRRIQFCHFLVQISVKVLGSKFSQTQLTLNNPAQTADVADASNVITVDASGNPTPAGFMLHHIMLESTENNGLTDKATTSFMAIFRDLFTLTCTGSEGKGTLDQISFALTISRLSEANDGIAWGIWTIISIASKLKPSQSAVADLPISYFMLVDQLVTEKSAEEPRVSHLLSAALTSSNASSLELDVVQRLWCAALSIKETLKQFSSIFCHLLRPDSIQSKNSFRTIWNATFGKIDLLDSDLPAPLPTVLRDCWESDVNSFEMPAWKKAREANQAGRQAISTAGYEADQSMEAAPLTVRDDEPILSKDTETDEQTQSLASSSSHMLYNILPDSQADAANDRSKTDRRKARSSTKRSGKRQRSSKRSSQAAAEREEESQSQTGTATHSGSKDDKEAITTRVSKRQKTSRLGGKGTSAILKRVGEPATSSSSSSTPSKRGDRSISGHSLRKTPRSQISEPLHQVDAQAQEDQTLREIENVLFTPEPPDDRVEVVIPALSQRQKDSADGAELTATQDVFALIRRAAQFKDTIQDLDTTQINQLMGTLEALRSTSMDILNERIQTTR